MTRRVSPRRRIDPWWVTVVVDLLASVPSDRHDWPVFVIVGNDLYFIGTSLPIAR